ncbi:hypothetical protein [Halalkalibacter alkaliphilus]|uniref:Uncharacterized protein n=1 Tax=Halalkalibacter alkaliphilus TaxID=2917993 RepID=A0A9X2CRU2_9BACI|nr:hypothetical protein [Halalkalibacter alkaliphilus]MCL7747034.1 hypothetical protein [Halalkalibacter alkaliphilus]
MKDWSNMIRNFRLETEDIRDGNGLCELKTYYSFYVRSELYKNNNLLTDIEKIELSKADLLLLQNVETVYNHLSKKYNFITLEKPIEEWWWHLHKIISGEIRFEPTKTVKTPIGKLARYSKGFVQVDLSIEKEEK